MDTNDKPRSITSHEKMAQVNNVIAENMLEKQLRKLSRRSKISHYMLSKEIATFQETVRPIRASSGHHSKGSKARGKTKGVVKQSKDHDGTDSGTTSNKCTSATSSVDYEAVVNEIASAAAKSHHMDTRMNNKSSLQRKLSGRQTTKPQLMNTEGKFLMHNARLRGKLVLLKRNPAPVNSARTPSRSSNIAGNIESAKHDTQHLLSESQLICFLPSKELPDPNPIVFHDLVLPKAATLPRDRIIGRSYLEPPDCILGKHRRSVKLFNKSVSAAIAHNKFLVPVQMQRQHDAEEQDEVTEDDQIQTRSSSVNDGSLSKYRQDHYAMSAKVSRFIRALETGLNIDHLIEKVSDLRIMISKRSIERQLAEMVAENKPIQHTKELEREYRLDLDRRVKAFLESTY